MAFIELDHVSHIYHAGTENEHQALSDVSLSIEEGEFVAILGTNGSGKSTLAKHLNALLLPTRGTCRIAGYDTCEEEDLWKIRQEVSMVFQNPDNQKRFCTAAAEFVVQKLEGWHRNPEQVEQINRQALAFAARELKRLQVWFGKTAEAEILKYDGTYLAEQLENSVWYDLQMIRVNGSLVGAVLGAVIYLAMYAMKGGAIL